LHNCSEKFTCEPRLLLGLARIYDMLNDPESAITYYKKVLVLDASCVEAIACLGAHFFYSDQVRHVSAQHWRL
jgi:tetratricopeptide repeat protein 8